MARLPCPAVVGTACPFPLGSISECAGQEGGRLPATRGPWSLPYIIDLGDISFLPKAGAVLIRQLRRAVGSQGLLLPVIEVKPIADIVFDTGNLRCSPRGGSPIG